MIKKIKIFLDLIKFEHTIFALPFAYLGLFLAEHGWPQFHTFFWVTITMITVRTSAMCLNRLIDQKIDEQNPRTQGRVQAIHLLKRSFIWIVTFVSISIAFFSAYQLNVLCFFLLPIPILLIWIYPYLKRITWSSHFILGIILGIAPYGGWLASRTDWSWTTFLLTVAVTTWVSGFDMFYALQDLEFDRTHQLKSFPARFGVKQTIGIVRVLHGITIAALLAFGLILNLSIWYWIGWTLATGLIIKEHNLVSRFGLGKINEAFFNMNAWVSVVIFIAVALDQTLR